MRMHVAAITACGALLTAAANADDGHFAFSVRIGGGVPVWYGPCGYGFAVYPPAGGAVGYGYGRIFSHPTYAAYHYAGHAYRASGYRIVVPRSYAYAHRGYDRYGYTYGEYHYPGRHYSYGYAARFNQIHPHPTFLIRGGHIRDYGHRGHVYRHHVRRGRSVYYDHAYRTQRRTTIHHRRTIRHLDRR